MRGCALTERWLRASPFLQALQTLSLLFILVLLTPAELSVSPCPPCPRCPKASQCVEESQATCGECSYTVNNSSKLLLVTSASYFELQCPDNMTLEDPSIPALEDLRIVPKVVLNGCKVPELRYEQALARLNVTVLDYLSIKAPAGKLGDDHFIGLNDLETLLIEAINIEDPLEADDQLLRPLLSLRKLYLFSVLITPTALVSPPPLLKELSLRQCRLEQLPPKTLLALPQLKALIIVDRELLVPPDIRTAKSLQRYTLNAPLIDKVILSSSLFSLTLESISNARLEGNCNSLRSLIVRNNLMTSLPERWIAQCPKVAQIVLVLRNLTVVPKNALEEAAALKTFQLINSRNLTTLPAELFRHTRNLTNLDLSKNNLTGLPTSIFTSLVKLERLDLSDNNFGSIPSHYTNTMLSLTDLTSLKRLVLDKNPLGSLCESSKTISSKINSPFYRLLSLERLSLADTNATNICTDWKDTLKFLMNLDLSGNNIQRLETSDLYWSRADNVKVEVNLQRNPLETIEMTPQISRQNSSRTTATIFIDSKLHCDCRMYWFAKALQNGWLPAKFYTLNCWVPPPVNSFLLQDLPLESMTCNVDKGCPINCSCELRAIDQTTLISCQNRGMTSVPDLTSLPGNLALNISRNELTSIPANFSDKLKSLDISHNKISEFTMASVMRITSGMRLRLASNRFSCRCGDPLLRRLRVPNAGLLIDDLGIAKCADGKSLVDASREDCWAVRAVIWGTVGASLMLFLTAAVFIALKKAVRLRLKAYLLARGLCVRWVKPDDNDDCKYDAFLSFSHLDTDYAEEILRKLESGPKRLKLCVHYRDWPLGIWIPAQIARSVAESRRTIILLSDNYVGSSWARAEFREAYAKAILGTSVRLIVVLLGDKPPKDLDEELQHYVNNNTYVKWGEHAFWEKLRTALPEPRHVQKKTKLSQKSGKSSKNPSEKTKDRRKRRKTRNKGKSSEKSNSNPNGNVNQLPEIVIVPNSLNVPAAPAPPTPIVKFTQIDFPAPIKPVKQEASPCA